MKKHIFFAIALSLVLTTLGLAFRNKSAPVPQNNSAAAAATLREKAKLRGFYKMKAEPKSMKRYDDVASLSTASDAIVVASVESQEGNLLNPTASFIVTECHLRLKQVLKGNVQAVDEIVVRVPGGTVVFEDGTSAQVEMPEYWRSPQVGKEYIWFLAPRQPGNFVLVGGPQGLFEVTSEGTVKPQVRSQDKLMQKYDGYKQDLFLKEIASKAVARAKS